jgi:hypothetical protein
MNKRKGERKQEGTRERKRRNKQKQVNIKGRKKETRACVGVLVCIV